MNTDHSGLPLGIYYDRCRDSRMKPPYGATAMVEGRTQFVGYFRTAEDAKAAREKVIAGRPKWAEGHDREILQ